MTTARQRSSAKEPQNLQPHSPEEESAALTAALQDPEAAKKVSEALSEDHFFDARRREIFCAIQSIVARREAVNVLSVYRELQERGGIAREIPSTMIHDLEAAGPATGYLPNTLTCLRSDARRRALIEAGTNLVQRIRENGRDTAGVVADFWEATKSLDIRTSISVSVTREGDDFHCMQESLGVEVQVSRLRDSTDGMQAELTVLLDGRTVHWGRANLGSLSAREGLVTKLRRSSSKIPWAEILEQVCRLTTEALRASTPTVQLQPVRGGVERHLVSKLIVAQETNVIFADGGSGKSLLGLALGIAVATGKTLAGGLDPRTTGAILYLDWESCEAEHNERLADFLAGLGIAGPVPIFYRRMAGALADDMPAIRQEVARLSPVLVIVDSLGPACGAEPEGADAAIRTLNALRSLTPSRLVLAHVSKLQADQRGPARPFGSVFIQNLPRNVWEIRSAEEHVDDRLTIGLYHRKANRGRLLPPFGLEFEFGKDATRIRSTDLTEDPGLRDRAGLSYSLLALLRSGGRTISDLVEETQATESGVKKALYRLEKAGKVVRLSEPGHGPGRPVEWGLKA